MGEAKKFQAFKALSDPPIMAKRQQTFNEFGQKREDPYFWFREKENPEVIPHLKGENDYLERHLAPYRTLRKKLFEEMKARDPKVRKTSPVRRGPYFYQERYPEGADYIQLIRYPVEYNPVEGGNDKVEVLFDLNKELVDHKNRNIESWCVDQDDHKIALSIDLDGSEYGHLYWRDLRNKDLIFTGVKNAASNLEWDDSGSFIYWVELSDQWRPYRIQAYDLQNGTSQLLFEESDPAYFIWPYRSSDERYIFISCQSKIGSETLFLDPQKAPLTLKSFHPRFKNYLVDLDHHPRLKFVAKSNYKSKNFSIFQADENKAIQDWKEIFKSTRKQALSDFAMGTETFLLATFEKGLPKLLSLNISDFSLNEVASPVADSWTSGVETSSLTENLVKVGFTSMTMPSKYYELNLETSQYRLIHETKFEGGHNPDNYQARVEYMTSHDGLEFPVSLAHKKGLDTSRPHPVVLYGYGSYGAEMLPFCMSSAISLMDRGFIFAIAHIRGGGEHGQQIYEEEGKFLTKKNTFYDFKAATEGLIAKGITQKGKVSIWGGSAGGLLVGATMNLDPSLYCSVLGEVAFVDVLNTMQDDSLPLTPTEWDEWGDPKEKEYYDYIKSYSPYDNIQRRDHPPCLFTGGLNDPRVTYWEPAKMVAKLREYNTSDAPILLYTNMEAGHAGEAGRYSAFEEEAMILTFTLAAHSWNGE